MLKVTSTKLVWRTRVYTTARMFRADVCVRVRPKRCVDVFGHTRVYAFRDARLGAYTVRMGALLGDS